MSYLGSSGRKKPNIIKTKATEFFGDVLINTLIYSKIYLIVLYIYVVNYDSLKRGTSILPARDFTSCDLWNKHCVFYGPYNTICVNDQVMTAR